MPFADENFFATSAQRRPCCEKTFWYTKLRYPALRYKEDCRLQTEWNVFKRKSYNEFEKCFSAFQEKINGERFFFSLAHLMYKEG